MAQGLTPLLSDLASLPDWETRYEYIIDLAASLPSMEEGAKTEENKVRGCISQVWMTTEWNAENRLNLMLDSDAVLVKGLLALVYAAANNTSKEELAESLANLPTQLEKVGLMNNLSPNRRSGFASVLKKLQTLAEEA